MPQPKGQVELDLSEAETLKCDECGNYTFIQSFFLKRISPIVSPTGKETIVPIQAFACGNCGKVAEGMLEGSGVDDTSSFPTLDI